MGLVVARKRVVPSPGGSKGIHAHVLEAELLLEVDRRQGGQRSPQRVPCRHSSRSFWTAQAPKPLDHGVARQAGGPKYSSDPDHCLHEEDLPPRCKNTGIAIPLNSKLSRYLQSYHLESS